MVFILLVQVLKSLKFELLNSADMYKLIRGVNIYSENDVIGLQLFSILCCY